MLILPSVVTTLTSRYCRPYNQAYLVPSVQKLTVKHSIKFLIVRAVILGNFKSEHQKKLEEDSDERTARGDQSE